ncbi:MAG TPA: hypothetical protein VK916_02860 [Gillisia sp.]|nr:hypothetical protein [Gillisia sp.]
MVIKKKQETEVSCCVENKIPSVNIWDTVIYLSVSGSDPPI